MLLVGVFEYFIDVLKYLNPNIHNLNSRLTPNNLLIMETNANSFSNDDITVSYNPKLCKNSGICALQLSSVFRTFVIPWIDLDGADTNLIINQINKCPSGALKYHLKQRYFEKSILNREEPQLKPGTSII